MRQANRDALDDLAGGGRPIIGMVHLPPLPGSPRWQGDMRDAIERATADARALRDAGFDAVLVENFGDAPFHPHRVPPETVAAMTLAVAAVRAAIDLPVGVNVLRNDAAAALGIAAATGARFIRCNVHTGGQFTDQGWVEGEAHRTLRRRAALDLRVAILADVHVKHAAPPPGVTLADAARDAWHRGLADALLVTGAATGQPPAAERIQAIREAVPEARVWIASGLARENADLFRLADGAIAGSAAQHGGQAGAGVDPERAAELVRALRAAAR